MMQTLLPQGRAWSRDKNADLTRLIHSEADGLARVEARADDLLAESFPGTTLEMLPEWEMAVGLPDICSEDYDDLENRRGALAVRLAEVGDQSVPFFKALAARLGISIEIQEWRSFRAGISRAGDHAGGEEWMFVWDVVATATPDCEVVTVEGSPFQAGHSTAGDSLVPSFINETYYGDAPDTFAEGLSVLKYQGHKLLECMIRALAPSHTHVNFTYIGEA